MSLQPRSLLAEVPVETARVARAAFPKGSLAVRLRDELGVIFTDEQFADLFPARGRGAWSPGRLALVSVLQFAEGLSDRQAAESVRARIDWKYALGMELTDPGVDYSVLSEFRARLTEGSGEQRVLEAVLNAAKALGLLRRGGRQRTDSTHVLASTRDTNRLETVGETLRAALNAIAQADGAWLSCVADAEWFDRYGTRIEDQKLPSGKEACAKWADQVGADGTRLLEAALSATAPTGLRGLEAVEILRRMWVQEFWLSEGVIRLRDPKERPPGALRLVTPYDIQARVGVKRSTYWDGYKVHLTETCEPDAPHLITHVATTVATVPDTAMTAVVHVGLAARDLLPGVHLADAGYVDARHILDARTNYGIDLVGPVTGNTGWQTGTDGAIATADFTVDWDNKQVTCPGGNTNAVWRNDVSQRGTPVVRAKFARRDCQPCPIRERCTRSPHGRWITLRPREEHEALHQARSEQTTPDWQRRYQHRSGVEGTIGQAANALGARHSRYRGLAKTSLQQELTAAGMNLLRLDAWLVGRPLARTRTSHLEALRPTELDPVGRN
ncbi:IS1182 family transposase [Streptomyces sp. NBC_00872]|uniref:IS1182 family transposase n=1 Tax=Streptomyces sp. NBC_00872 TaxID=2903686 RepID=UPI0038667A24|nr:IS1182 family transposase [Streptomyces sp. NBC_00872]